MMHRIRLRLGLSGERHGKRASAAVVPAAKRTADRCPAGAAYWTGASAGLEARAPIAASPTRLTRSLLVLAIAAVSVGPNVRSGHSREVIFRDTFDNHPDGATMAGAVPEIGDSWTRLTGAPELQVVQSAVSRGGKSLRITRPARGFQGLRGECDPRACRLRPNIQIAIRADFYREDDKQAARISLAPFGRSGFKPAIWAKAEGNFAVWSSEDGSEWRGKWIDTGHCIGHGWQTVEIVITWGEETKRFVRGRYDVYITRHEGHSLGPLSRTRIAHDVPALGVPVNTLLHMGIDSYDYQQEHRESVTYWDNVIMEVGSK